MPSSQSLPESQQKKLITPLLGWLALLSGLLFYSAWNLYLGDSEIWAVTVSRTLGSSDHFNVSVYYKPLFNFLLKCLYALPLSSSGQFLASRTLFALIGISTVALTAVLVFKSTRSKISALISAVLLLASSLFMTRGFGVRSDNLATLCFLASLITFSTRALAPAGIDKNLKVWALPFVLSLATLAATPKAAFLMVIGFAFSLTWLMQKKLGGLQSLTISAFVFLLPLGLMGSAGAIALNLTGSRAIQEAYTQAIVFFLSGFSEGPHSPGYLSAEDFFYVRKVIVENPHLFLFVFLTPLVALWIKKSLPRREENKSEVPLVALLTLNWATSAAFLFHNQKYPFFLVSLMPFLTASATVIGYSLIQSLRPSITLRLVGIMAILLAPVPGLFVLKSSHKNFSNSEQIVVINELEQKISGLKPTRRHATHYDIIGLLPRLNTVYGFAGAGDTGKYFVLKKLIHTRPEFIFYVFRFEYLKPEITRFLEDGYAPLKNGVWARAITEPILLRAGARREGNRLEIAGENLYRLFARQFRASPGSIRILSTVSGAPSAPQRVSLLRGGRERSIEQFPTELAPNSVFIFEMLPGAVRLTPHQELGLTTTANLQDVFAFDRFN